MAYDFQQPMVSIGNYLRHMRDARLTIARPEEQQRFFAPLE